MLTSPMAEPRWRPRRRLDGRLRLWRTCTRRGRRDEPNGTHHDDKRRTTTAGDEEDGSGGSVGGGGGAPVTGDDGERAAELLYPLEHLLATAASGGDGGDGATSDERARDLGQTVEDD